MQLLPREEERRGLHQEVHHLLDLILLLFFNVEYASQSGIPLLNVMAPVVVGDGATAFAFVQIIQRANQSASGGEGTTNDQKSEGRLDRHDLIISSSVKNDQRDGRMNEHDSNKQQRSDSQK